MDCAHKYRIWVLKLCDRLQEFAKHVTARQRRRMSRGLQRKCNTLMVRLRKDKKAAPPGERPDGVKTHVRR
jgi:small subunit ribosomal protein S15e